MPAIIFFTFLITSTPLWFLATNSFDKLVQLEYELFRQQWIADGMPIGLFWKPPDAKILSRKYFFRGFALTPFLFRWFINSPEWTQSNARTKRALRKFKLFEIIWLSYIFLLFVADLAFHL